ncbi:HAD family hydrolase [Undibacterium arcticum]|uniref:HAD family hydrolase n=1 Tax=Undibacterium arcticum TaxID=1762892 RepID=A0ABV7F892_9BURK
MKKPVKAVLFDLDDTLWSIGPVLVRAEAALFDWMRQHAPQVPQQFSIETLQVRRKVLMAGNPRYQIDLWALRHAVLTEAFNICGEDLCKVDAAMDVFSRARSDVVLYDDVRPSLTRLGQRHLLGTISNGFADLATIGLAHHFQVSIAAHQFGCAKPDREIFHAACDLLHVAPVEAVYVGDDPTRDIAGAQGAGLRAVWLNRADLLPQRGLPPHVNPDAVVSNLFELEQWLSTQ